MFKKVFFLFWLIFSVFSFTKFSCLDRFDTFENYAYFSSPNYPQNLAKNDLQNCRFEFTNPGNYRFVFTNGNLCNLVIEVDGKTQVFQRMTVEEQISQNIYGKTMSFYFKTNESESDFLNCPWQAFQAVIFNLSDSFVPKIPLKELYATNLTFPLTSLIENRNSWTFENGIEDLTGIKLLVWPWNDAEHDTLTADFCGSAITIFLNSYLCPLFSSDDISIDWSTTSHFYVFVSIATKRDNMPTECHFELLEENHWIFSAYDETNGYLRNSHCYAPLNATYNHQYFFWVEHLNLEDLFDLFSLETTVSFDKMIIDTTINSVNIIPYSDVLFRFDSDDSINQVGFIIHIQQIECSCGQSILTVPCDGSIVNKTFLDDDRPELNCNKTCGISIIMANDCRQDVNYVYITVSTTPNLWSDPNDYFNVTFIQESTRYDLIGNFFFLHDSKQKFRLEYLANQSNEGTAVGTHFSLHFQKQPDPRIISYVLDSKNESCYFDLKDIQNNVIVKVKIDDDLLNEDYHLEMFGVGDNPEDLTNIGVYVDDLTNYKHSLFENLNERLTYNMPKYSLINGSTVFIYVGNFNISTSYMLFFRIREFHTENCLFLANVIDFSAVLENADVKKIEPEITMVNNGSDFCQITFFCLSENNFTPQKYSASNFWTTAKNENVEFWDENEIIFEFHSDNVTNIKTIDLDDVYYRILIPPKASLTFMANLATKFEHWKNN